MKKAIFTVLFNDYDILKPAPKFKGWDAVLFTDKVLDNSLGWSVTIVQDVTDPKKTSREYKILSHQYLAEYDLVCYVDASGKLLKEPPSVPVFFKHYSRNTVKDEAGIIIKLGMGDPEIIYNQVKDYYKEGFKDDQGLYANGFFVRDHKLKTNQICEYWWTQITKYTHRDQLSLPYVIWSLGIKLPRVVGYHQLRQFVRFHPHNNKTVLKPGKVNVHHITPARTDKNFGQAINQIIESLPENDWICLRDIDTFPPYHEEFIKQIEIIANGNHKFDLIGCMTNRLGLKHQLVPGMFDVSDIKVHRDKAKELSKICTIREINKHQSIGGLMMLFSKSTWLKAGKFPEGGIQVKGSFLDYHFSKAVSKFGKLGIAEGVYLYHNYRMDGPAITHLI